LVSVLDPLSIGLVTESNGCEGWVEAQLARPSPPKAKCT